MLPIEHRAPSRMHLVHSVIARLRGRGYWSAHQVAQATFWGCGRLHRQQRKRIRLILDRYVDAGILERNDTIAACPLYRHRDVTLKDVDQEMVKQFEAHANRRRVTPSYEMDLRMLDMYLDQLIPQDTDPELFNEYGHLMGRELMAMQDQCWVVPERSTAFGVFGV